MIEIKSLKTVGYDELFEAFSAAFADYELQLSYTQLRKMLDRRGYLPELSFGAFDDNALISFTCNGTGIYNNKKTAYDTGTGTVKSYRGQKLAGSIFQHSLPYLREAGITQYLLEVLKHNPAAISVYTKQGFEVTREFSYFIEPLENILIDKLLKNNEIKIIDGGIDDILPLSDWCDFEPSWQNSFASIERQPGSFVIKIAIHDEIPVGYCVFEPCSGDITQIAVDRNFRRRGAGSALLAEALKICSANEIKLINTDNHQPGIGCWAEYAGLKRKGEQYEMILQL
jgi:ribosomal protein S18 acetylase RimI-like enzyme